MRYIICVLTFILGLCAASGLWAAVPDASADLVLHLNETSGTTFVDASGKGHNGTCSGSTCPTMGIRGEFGGGMRFDGSNDEIFVTIDVSETSYTSSLWFNTTDSNRGIFSVVDISSGGHDRHIYLSGGSICVRTWSDETICGGSNLADGRWHHVAHVFGGSTGGQKIWVDGEMVASGSKSQSDFSWQTGVRVGVSVDSFNANFKGMLDEVSVFNRDLSPLEIMNLYKRGAYRQNIAVDPAAHFVIYTAISKTCLNERPFFQALSNGKPAGTPKALVACSALPDDILGLDLLAAGANQYWLSFTGSQVTDGKYLMKIDASGSILVAPKAVLPSFADVSIVSGTALQQITSNALRMWFVGNEAGYLYRATIGTGNLAVTGMKKVALASMNWTNIQSAVQGFVGTEAPQWSYRAFGMDAYGNPNGANWRLSPRTEKGHRWGALAADGGMALSDVDYNYDQLYAQPLAAGIPSVTPSVAAKGTDLGSADISGPDAMGARVLVFRSTAGIYAQKVTAAGVKIGAPVKLL